MFSLKIISRFITIAYLLACPLFAVGQTAPRSARKLVKENSTFPVPSEKPDMLFYLQRSLDFNSVIYEANYVESRGGQRKLNADDPVNIYWLMDDKEGSTKPLSKVQRLGYGIRPADAEGDVVPIRLVAYQEMGIFLKPWPKEDRYRAHIMLGGRDVVLSRVFINIDGGTKLKPNVTYIEITGTDSLTGKGILHRFKP
ncbi:hypothetical protein DYBT9275_05991 [Dyadobacter sp. CECT 9275]|uniref:DUF4833 domain-containing protein n=1 Tax=Dyadobacter helix TaxID=2822344 RepID=A0A916N8U2_9BACT|nr:DUF4833 domain-containing protein [Dyadobacter sp. CECT 9275]CAG5018389.1 hypothetical protein DYBT9275_05991 [Dyadobacter sp. CECT 9275]